MLSLSNVSPQMAFSYFSSDDYYDYERSDLKPEFQGNLYKNLEKKDFEKNVFANLLNGYTPDGKEKVVNSSPKNISIENFKNDIDQLNLKLQKKGLLEDSKSKINNLLESSFDKEKPIHLDFTGQKALKAETNLIVKSMQENPKDKKYIRSLLDSFAKKYSKSNARAGIDATFSAPKSVSIIALTHSNQNIKNEMIEAHKDSVSYALHYVEKLARTRKRLQSGERIVEKIANISAAKFLHGTSREGDPQLHTHCVIMNQTKRSDGRICSLSNEEIYKQSKLLGVIYQNKLAEKVQKLGYEITPDRRGTFEIKGFKGQQLEAFSKRRKQVQENSAKELHKNEIVDYLRSKNIEPTISTENHKKIISIPLGSKTKDLDVQLTKQNGAYKVEDLLGNNSFKDRKTELLKKVNQKMNRKSVKIDRKTKEDFKQINLKAKWKKEAKEIDLMYPDKNRKSKNFEYQKPVDTNIPIKDLNERDSIWSVAKIKLTALIHNLGRTSYEVLNDALKKDLNIIHLDQKIGYKTNLQTLQIEENLKSEIIRGKDKVQPISIQPTRYLKDKGFTNGQKNAVIMALESRDLYIAWSGVAGSGKTYALETIKSALKDKNRCVRIVAIAATKA